MITTVLWLRKKANKWAKEELQPEQLVKSAFTALIIFILEAIYVIAFTAFIFSGDLARHLPLAISLTLMGDAILCLIVGIFSSYPGSIAVEQDAPAAIIAVVIASVLTLLPANTTSETKFATALMLVLFTTILTGIFFIILGYFKLGDLARYLPYPVMGGFLAGTGWLLVTGAISIVVENTDVANLIQPDVLRNWLPAFALALIVLVVGNRWNNPLILPALITISILAFYLIAWNSGESLESLRAQNWLMGGYTESSRWEFPFSMKFLRQADWSIVLSQAGNILPILAINIVALLLNTNSLELVAKRDINLNQELIVAGLGNTVSGLFGGLVGYHAISISVLSFKLGGGKRIIAILSSLLLCLPLIFGFAMIFLMPKFVMAGVVFYVGLSLLYEWIVKAWKKFSAVDFIVILVILGVIAWRGFLEGVAIGVLATILLFVINYSRTSMIKAIFTGKEFHSRFTRTPAERSILDKHGQKIYIIELHNFIFFGTANKLYDSIKERILAPGLPALEYIILDFSRVSGMDATGLLSFEKLRTLAEQHNFILILSGTMFRSKLQFSTIHDQLIKNGFVEIPGRLRIFEDLDHSVEWCENQVISQIQPELLRNELPTSNQYALDEQLLTLLFDRLDEVCFAPGDYLMRQGDAADYMFIIKNGRVTSQIEKQENQPIRLETLRGGSLVGEIGFYLGTPRSASVIAEEETITYRVSQTDLKKLEVEDPQAAQILHRLIITLLSRRTLHLTNVVKALQK